MEMTPIELWLPGPGELLELVPTAATLTAAGEAPTSTARPSSIQASHIQTAMDRRGRGLDWSPWLAFAFHVQTPLNRAALQAAFNEFVTRHGTLLSWFEGDVENLTRRVIAPQDVELEITSRGQAASTDEARQLITDRFSGNTSPLIWPSFIAGAIDHDASPQHGPGSPTAGFTIYYGVDHSHTDGVSILLGVEELHELYQRKLVGNTEPLAPVGSYVEFSAAERDLEETLTLESPAVAVWLAALSDTGFALPSFAMPLGLDPGATAPSTRMVLDIADAATIDAFEQVVKRAGGSMAAGWFAALATVDAELTGRAYYMALNAVATRFEPIYRAAQGWFINLVPVTANLTEAQTFEQRVAALHRSLDRARAAAPMPARAIVNAVMAAMGNGSQVSTTAVPPMVSYIDMRRFRGAELEGADQITALGGPGNTGDVSLWINRRSERTYVMASFPNTPTAQESVSAYIAALAEVVARTAEAASLSV
jgi:condensation domain-containing protein